MARARHHTYTFLSRLYLDGLTEELLAYAEAVPELAAVLSPPFQPDAAAADHQHLFGFNVFPYESIFLDPQGLLGGIVTDALIRYYQEVGFQIDASTSSPDHIGYELGLLAFLCGAEADAWENDLPAVAENRRRQQQRFLQTHLLRWLLPLVIGVRQQSSPFYRAVADLTLDLAHSHTADLGQSPAETAPPFALPAPPPLLEDRYTGLSQIARYLTTPPYSGVFLSRDDVADLARRQQLPRGFGSRHQMLTNLMRSAVQYDAFPNLLQLLHERVAGWESEYTSYAGDLPQAAPFAEPWQERTAVTTHLLAQIRTQTNMF